MSSSETLLSSNVAEMRKTGTWGCSSGSARSPSQDSEQLMQGAKEVFDMAAKDESGCVDMWTLCAAMSYADALLGIDDDDRSGTVNREEWIAYFQQMSKDSS